MDDYKAATVGCGLVARADRALLRVHGRAPRQMLQGILTNRVPGPPVALSQHPGALADHPDVLAEQLGALAGEVVYGAILTAKGRMVSDQKTFWLGTGEADGLGLDIAAAGHAAALGHFARFLPPRMARIEDLKKRVALLTVVGAGAREAVAGAFGAAPETGCVLLDGEALAGGALTGGALAGGVLAGGVLLAKGVEQPPSWDVWVPHDGLAEARRRIVEQGAVQVEPSVWETLRVEEGFPRFGVDMDESTIPVEAGLVDRAFDHEKGCYTGQEVIVRIRHRGRVNWRLRTLRFGDATAVPGDLLFGPDAEKARGRITSVVQSPRFGQAVGLGYVRREVEPPAVLHLGSASGPPVDVAVAAPERQAAQPPPTDRD